MTSTAPIAELWPKWMTSAGTMLRMNARVRSRCARCGTLLRVELTEVVALNGPGYSLIDRVEMCRMVGCSGTSFFLAARTYGQDWRVLLRDNELLAALDDLAPVRVVTG